MVVVDGDELKRKGIILEPSLLKIPMCCKKEEEEIPPTPEFVWWGMCVMNIG